MRANAFTQRRRLLQGAGAMASLGIAALPAARAAAAGDAGIGVFAAKTFAEAIGELGGAPLPSSLITLEAPAIVENGAFVPVTVTSALPGTHEILLLVDGNPQPVAVQFTIPAGTEPFVATRIRMAGSGTLYAAVRNDDGFFATARAISVNKSGCA